MTFLFAALSGAVAGTLVSHPKHRVLGGITGLLTGATVGLLLRKDGALMPAEPPIGPRPKAPVPEGCPTLGTRVLLIGDSHAEGLAPNLAREANRCGTPYLADFERGSGVNQWKGTRLDSALATAQPTHVLISLGGNDMSPGRDPQNLAESIDKLISKIEKAGAVVMWINPPPFPFPDPNDVRGMWKTRSGNYFDSEALPLEKGPDDIHLTPAGYRSWSENFLWPWLVATTVN